MKICLRNEVDVQAERLQGWLSHGTTYAVLSIEKFSSGEIGLRVVSEDSRQPVVFRASLFDVVDNKVPRYWKVLSVRSGAIKLGPEEFGQPGFWEKCFDRDPIALDDYRRAKEKVIAES